MSSGQVLDVHPPKPDEGNFTYQENMLITWYDPQRGIGGSHSVRTELNVGTSTIWSGLSTADGKRWRRNRAGVPLQPVDHTSLRHGAGPLAFVGGDALGVQDLDDDVEIRLVIEDFFEPLYPWGQGERRAVNDQVVQQVDGHVEAAGRIHGQVRMGDSKFDVDGLCFRDHSWALGDMSLILSHTWVAGTFGPELSWSAIIYQGVDGNYMRGGSIIRDGELISADRIDIVNFVECDGVSHRGGEITFFLPDGETLRLVAEAVDGFVFQMGQLVIDEAFCTVRVDGAGPEGFTLWELHTGQGRRPGPVTAAFRATALDGFTTREDA